MVRPIALDAVTLVGVFVESVLYGTCTPLLLLWDVYIILKYQHRLVHTSICHLSLCSAAKEEKCCR